MTVKNDGTATLMSAGNDSVHLGAHLLGSDSQIVDNDLARAKISVIKPGGSAQVIILLPESKTLGFRASILPVQERVAWFNKWGIKPVMVGPFKVCRHAREHTVCGQNNMPIERL